MFLDLREDTPHGTAAHPYSQHYIHDLRRPFQFPVHWHDEMEIIYVRRGTLRVWIEGRDYRGTAGDAFWVNPRELHLMGSEDLETAYYTLLFPLDSLSFQTVDNLDAELLMPLRSGRLRLSGQAPASLAGRLAGLLEQVIAIGQEEAPCRQLRTRLLLLEMLALLVENGCLAAPAGDGSRPDRPWEILAYLQDHYTERLSLERLASQFYLSPKYLSRYFREHFHITFVDYVRYLRSAHARRLLETTELPVTEVALASGFPNVSYFIRSFKERYGCTPLRYRRQRRGRPV